MTRVGLDVKVLHWNIYGHVGNANSDVEVRVLVESLVRLVHERQPDLVSLNEVCKSQADGLAAALDGEYQLFASLAWWPAVHKAACGGSYGNAILVRSKLADDGQPLVRQLPVDRVRAADKRPVVGLAMPVLRTLFCSTHLTVGSSPAAVAERAFQVATLHETFEPFNARGWNIVFGADLNTLPGDPVLDSVYEPSYGGGAHGIYREAHPDRTTKAATTDIGRAIDYIFVNDQPISISAPTITKAGFSDHHVYEAVTRLRTP